MTLTLAVAPAANNHYQLIWQLFFGFSTNLFFLILIIILLVYSFNTVVNTCNINVPELAKRLIFIPSPRAGYDKLMPDVANAML